MPSNVHSLYLRSLAVLLNPLIPLLRQVLIIYLVLFKISAVRSSY